MDYEGGDHKTADRGCIWLLAACLGPVGVGLACCL